MSVPILKTTLNLPYEKTIKQITASLKEQGLTVLMRIDVQEMLRQTLGIEVEGYVILVAGNAVLTYLLLQAEPDIGVLLFCSIVVREAPTETRTHVSVLHPDMMVRVSGNPTLQTIVDEILIRLWHVINAL